MNNANLSNNSLFKTVWVATLTVDLVCFELICFVDEDTSFKDCVVVDVGNVGTNIGVVIAIDDFEA